MSTLGVFYSAMRCGQRPADVGVQASLCLSMSLTCAGLALPLLAFMA